jgi:hypothetical protein
MLKFFKKKTDISGTETGDFYGFDASILFDDLKPLNARCDTAEVEITVYPLDDKIPLDETAIRTIVTTHGSKEAIAQRELDKEHEKLIQEEAVNALRAQETAIRAVAIDTLKAAGKLPPDFPQPVPAVKLSTAGDIATSIELVDAVKSVLISLGYVKEQP